MKKLEVKTLKQAIIEMAIGETCISPDGYKTSSVKRTCSEINREGKHLITTTRKEGILFITKLS